MKNRKLLIAIVLLFSLICGLLFLFSTKKSYGESSAFSSVSDDEPKGLKIVYTNDIHSYIYNTIKDSDGNSSAGLRLSNVSALVNDLRSSNNDVILVDAGDEVQGAIYGSIDMGHSIIELMNISGYQIACPGNHDFDYGVDVFLNNAEAADFPYISCNFKSAETDKTILQSSAVIDTGLYKVAFIGICSPTTISNSTPKFFQNENGEYLYSFDGYPKIDTLFSSVQSEIDSLRNDVDYVVAISHVGIEYSKIINGTSAMSIIANTSGLDALIDGHSHSVEPCTYVKDKSGKDVLYTQTGSFLNNVGVLDFYKDGSASAYLLNEYDNCNPNVAKLENELYDIVQDQMGQVIAELPFTLYTTDPTTGLCLVRSRETNMGDFVPDSIYWYFNEMLGIQCDIVLSNGGGIRNDIKNGKVTYMDAKSVEPFGNQICLISATGQEIIDCLEFGANQVNTLIDKNGSITQNGGFMQVAGLCYTIDGELDSSAQSDDKGMFVSINGEYKVKDVSVYNQEKGIYEAIVPNASYNIGAINYLLRNSGCGMTMFTDNKLLVDYVGQDADILALYMKSFAPSNGISIITTSGSVLSTYPGYLIDYENPYGSRRITVS